MRVRGFVGMLLLTAAVLMCANTAPVRAQDKSSYDDLQIELGEDVIWTNIGISLLRDPALPPENFIINMSAAERYSTGCPPLKDMGFETEYKSHALEIKILKLTVDQSEFPYYKCNGKSRNPKADVILNKKDLQDKGVKKIKIVDGSLIKTYEADITDEKIELSVDEDCEEDKNNKNAPSCQSADITTIRMQSVNNVKNPLRLWFYPEGTLMLYAPGVKADPQQVKDKIRSFAIGMGLTPLEDIYPEFKSPLIRNEYSYFVDKDSSHGPAAVDGAELGNISIEKMAYGLNGDVPTTEQVKIFARKPGAYD